jgi:ribA/ribD-fused uncharacterized protein
MSIEELNRFYKAKSKKPDLYGYDDNGNLIELNKEGSVIKTIALPDYRPPTFEEFDEMEKKRMDSIAVLNKEYENARRRLREAINSPDITDSEIIRLNRQVVETDIRLQNIRFPLQYIESIDGLEIKEIDFNQSSEKRKYPYPFYFYETRPFKLQEQYVRIGKLAEKPLISVAEAKAAADAFVPVILFAEPETNDYGFLSLDWVVQIEFNSTMYNSVKQAISAEIAKSFNDTDNLQKIMLAETPDEINYKVINVPGDTEINETKWNDLTKQLLYDVNLAKFNQFPELAGRLLETKNATLGAYLPDDNLIGIGISLDNIQSKNPVNWTGQNLLGKALMDIREKLRVDREIAVQQAPVSVTIPRKKRPVVSTQPVMETEESSMVASRPIRRRPIFTVPTEAIEPST